MKNYLPLAFAGILIALVYPGSLLSQVTFQPKESKPPDAGIVYTKETTFDVFLHTSGLGFGMKFGDLETYYRTSYYHIEWSTLKHSKEVRQSNRVSLFNVLSRPYVYGKQNSFSTIRAGMGNLRYFSEKAKRRGIAVGVNYQGGLSIGLQKPYYLDLRSSRDGDFGPVKSERYSEANHDRFLDQTLIEGYSGFFTGVDELSFVPGIHVKGGIHFAWGAFEEKVRALEVGIMVDVFFKEVPIMITAENKPYFINLYLTLQFGSRR
jgi:hypothetical protein